ncbi:MAG TPA: DUF4783 domain-containing protein [Bacteroidales bacterium]|nr:DUF4783 domain-containing protein [Bacteroidales bacterium]
MKYFFIIVVCSLFTLRTFAGTTGTPGYGDTTIAIIQEDITTSIAAAIKDGDSKKLASYFNSSIDLTVPGTEGTYSKSQAEMIVKDFFTKFPPVTFKINQQGSSTEGSQFAVGILATKSGVFRTYFLIKKVNNLPLIHQLQFEEE